MQFPRGFDVLTTENATDALATIGRGECGVRSCATRILLVLARFGKDQIAEWTIIPKIIQETPAEMVGTTRSRVSFFMNKFRKLGFIKYNGGMEVHSSMLNVVLHD
jgi:hypothetical protein